MVDSRRRRNFMVAVRVNGTWLFKDADIKEGVANAFPSLLFEEGD